MTSHTTGICPECGGAQVCYRQAFKQVEQYIQELDEEIERCDDCIGAFKCDTHNGLRTAAKQIKKKLGDLHGR